MWCTALYCNTNPGTEEKGLHITAVCMSCMYGSLYWLSFSVRDHKLNDLCTRKCVCCCISRHLEMIPLALADQSTCNLLFCYKSCGYRKKTKTGEHLHDSHKAKTSNSTEHLIKLSLERPSLSSRIIYTANCNHPNFLKNYPLTFRGLSGQKFI